MIRRPLHSEVRLGDGPDEAGARARFRADPGLWLPPPATPFLDGHRVHLAMATSVPTPRVPAIVSVGPTSCPVPGLLVRSIGWRAEIANDVFPVLRGDLEVCTGVEPTLPPGDGDLPGDADPVGGGAVFGNSYLTEKDGGFTSADQRLVEVPGVLVGAAVDNARLSDRLQQLAVQAERERISRDLHDGIIQTLFSIGMGLESARSMVGFAPDRVASRLDDAVDAIDTT